MTRREPRWVCRLVIEAVQLDQIREHGGRLGIRDEKTLESALARPRERWTQRPDTDLPRLAADYVTALGTSEPFHSGNRRIAFLSAVVFLGLNGFDFVPPEDELVQKTADLAAGRIDDENVAGWIRARISAAPTYPTSPKRTPAQRAP